MIKNRSIRKSIMEVEKSENLEQLKEGVLAVFKEIDGEIEKMKVDLIDIRKEVDSTK